MNDAMLAVSPDVWGTRLQLTTASEPLTRPDGALAEYVAVFHDWIRHGTLDELLIDVTSYEHVPGGPGVLLVGHETDYSVSRTGDRILLVCRHKRHPGDQGDALRRCFRRLVRAAVLLHDAPALSGPPRFTLRELVLHCNDRLLHPNDDATARALEPELRRFFGAVGGGASVDVQKRGEPRERLTLRITLGPPGEELTLASVEQRLRE